MTTNTVETTRPRDVDRWRAAAILYGDWGTSKAYVLGLAFALAGHASFWFILAVSLLTILVGINYTAICRCFPYGGGVYTSVRTRSPVLSLIGAFFLISDYIVTAALSAVSAFHYLGVSHPEQWAIAAIAIIGVLNFFGPKHTGSLAIALAIPTVLVVIALALLTIPFLPEAIHNLKPVQGGFEKNWNIFVTIIVALSGVEAIANTTSSMRLDPGSSYADAKISKTSTPAILMVMLEVSFFTALFGLALNALPGLEIVDGDVNAPGFPNVRDAMMRYMGEVFAGKFFGVTIGTIFGNIISIVVALLLLSAVNTAVVGLTSLLFVMSRDEEIPSFFQRLNRFGVPIFSTMVAFLPPIFLLFVMSDVARLANLYAIGFVGAIAVNLGATSTNFQLDLTRWERVLMFGTFIIMALIEITLFVDKPHARNFVVSVVTIGLLLRALVAEQKVKAPLPLTPEKTLPKLPPQTEKCMLVAVTGLGKALDYAIEESQHLQMPLQILFVREQKIVTPEDNQRLWVNDNVACQVFDYASAKSYQIPIGFLYTVTDHTAHSIIEIARNKKASRIFMGAHRRSNTFIRILRGTTVRDLSRLLPENIDLMVVY